MSSSNSHQTNEPCRHGAPPPASSAYKQAIRFQLEFLNRSESKLLANEKINGIMIITEMISDGFSPPSNHDLALALGVLVEYFLSSIRGDLPAEVHTQKNLRLSVLCAIEEFTSFMEFMRGDCTPEEEKEYEKQKILHSPLVTKIFKSTLASVQYVSDRIPCFCLDEMIDELSRPPLVQHCENCDKEQLKEELLVCGSCNTAEYCSKECQMANWRSHKVECTKLASLLLSDEETED